MTATHEVTNQATPLSDVNLFTGNRALQDPSLIVPGAPVIPPGVESMAAFPLRCRGQVAAMVIPARLRGDGQLRHQKRSRANPS